MPSIVGILGSFARNRTEAKERALKEEYAKLQGRVLEKQLMLAEAEAAKILRDQQNTAGLQSALSGAQVDPSTGMPQLSPQLLQAAIAAPGGTNILNALTKAQTAAQYSAFQNQLMGGSGSGGAPSGTAGGGMGVTGMQISPGGGSINMQPRGMPARQVPTIGPDGRPATLVMDDFGNPIQMIPGYVPPQQVDVSTAGGGRGTAFVTPTPGAVIPTQAPEAERQIPADKLGDFVDQRTGQPPPLGTLTGDPNVVPKGRDVPAGDAGKTAALAQGAQRVQEIRAMVLPDGKVNRQVLLAAATKFPGSEGRQLNNMVRDTIDAVFRARTGSAAPESEAKAIMDQFMPSALDNDSTVQDKLGRLEQFLSGSFEALNLPDYIKNRLGVSGDTAAPKRAINPQTNEVIELRGGQWVPVSP